MVNVVHLTTKQTVSNTEECECCKEDIEGHFIGLVYDRGSYFENRAVCANCEDIYKFYGII